MRRRRDLGDYYGEANSLIHLGDTHHTTGNLAVAGTAWQQALTILDHLQHADADELRTRLHRPHAGAAKNDEG